MEDRPSDQLHTIRHSLAHVMAQAVLSLRPGSTLGFGPPIDDGFYYDFVLSAPLTEEDFPEIEKRMKAIIGSKQPFEREDLPRDEAMARLDRMNEPYKKEYATELFDTHGIEKLTFYRNGPFLDMCEGPHVENTRQIPNGCYKLRSIAGAYWRGDSKNVMMTRLYAWAFDTREQLEEHVRRFKEAQARDHKKLGRELDIFVIDEVIGKGLAMWLPNGTVIRDELEKLARELEFRAGYVRVATPHLARTELYYKTGHLPYYAAHMYPSMEVKETVEKDGGQVEVVKESYSLKPMNCPHHHRLYAARMRSYRDLPLRLAEYGQVYRLEDSGALSGLLRVRGMAMNDAHIYCTHEQIKQEFIGVMQLQQKAFEVLGFKDFFFRFSTWDPDDPKGQQKYVDNRQAWEHSQAMILDALRDLDLPYVEGKGEAAFYGPKIDVQLRTVTGREESVSTDQLDFAVPGRLGLVYTGSDDREHVPYCIHRAPLSTHERLVAFLIEHYAGAFPTWLAPVQVRVITVSEKFTAYGETIVRELREDMVRAELDLSNETVGKKVRGAVTHKIPNVLVVGEREQQEGKVTLRRHGSQDQVTMPLAEFKTRLAEAIKKRSTAL